MERNMDLTDLRLGHSGGSVLAANRLGAMQEVGVTSTALAGWYDSVTRAFLVVYDDQEGNRYHNEEGCCKGQEHE